MRPALLGLSLRSAPIIARTGVAVFGLSLLLPMFISSIVTSPSAEVMVVNELPPYQIR